MAKTASSSAPVLRVGNQRPIMALLDLIGRRWALRILWELRESRLTSRGLRAAADQISPSVLQTRLDELREAGLVDLDGAGYGLTESGRALMAAFLPLYRFAEDWAETMQRG